MNEMELFHGKRCVSCGRYFAVDPRVGERQKCCRREGCRKKRKRLQERAWKERNPGYFEGHYVSYVKPWRAAHPGYQSRWRAQKRLRCKRADEIKTEMPSETPIKSMRIHLRCNWPWGEIKTQVLRVRQAGQAFWVDGVTTQPPGDKNRDG